MQPAGPRFVPVRTRGQVLLRSGPFAYCQHGPVRPILFRPIPPRSIPCHHSRPIMSDLISSHRFPSHASPFHLILFRPIRLLSILAHPIQSHSIPSHPIPSHPIPSHPSCGPVCLFAKVHSVVNALGSVFARRSVSPGRVELALFCGMCSANRPLCSPYSGTPSTSRLISSPPPLPLPTRSGPAPGCP